MPSNSLRAVYAGGCSAVCWCTLSRASAAVTQLLLGGRTLVRWWTPGISPGHPDLQGVPKRLVNFSGLYHSHFLDFSQCFGLFYTINYRRFFILVLLGHEIEKKGLKISSSKKVRIQGWLKLAQFLLIEIWGLPTLHSFISGISPSIFKILVPILLQISWIF